MKSKLEILAGVVMCLMVCGTLFAHHGTGVSYDSSKQVTLTGVVTLFNFRNPHVQLYFDVKDESGKVVPWAVEFGETPGMLIKQGWKGTTIKSGDTVTLTVNPSIAGKTVGNTVRSKPVLLNGKVLRSGGAE